MGALPRVTELVRERIAREFDDLGPDVCMGNIKTDLRRHNPELLDMASRWAKGARQAGLLMTGFGMFYRLMTAQSSAPLDPQPLSPLPRISAKTRDLLVERMASIGDEAFVQEAVDRLATTNPELLQLAHGFASQRADYARTMHGFALFYEALWMQSQSDKAARH